MGIYLRSENAENGDVIDLYWYCSYTCYADSIQAGIPLDEGGAYPCGAESDSPDFCRTCGKPVGNPLTSEGRAYLLELISDSSDPEQVAELKRLYL